MDWLRTAIDTLTASSTEFLMKLVSAVAVLVIGSFLIKRITRRMRGSKRLDKIDPGAKNFLVSFNRIALYIVLFFTVAAIVGIPTASLIAIVSSCGLAIGLALQGGLSNLAGGLLIIVFKPFRTGDYIKVDDSEGTVSEINLFYTVLKTADNRRVTIPNGNITGKTVTDITAYDTRRADYKFLTSYGDDPEKVKKVILGVAKSDPLILSDPEPKVFLTSHEDSGYEFTLYVWSATKDYWTVRWNIYDKVQKAFAENGISIPYRTIDVNIKKDED